MKAWAIRDKTTGLYLEYSTKHFSSQEAISENKPRLFPAKKNAVNCLTAWLQGEWKQSGGYDSYSGEYDSELAPRKVEGRLKEKMEIVEFDLLEVKCLT